jgi:hypothetical protein
MVREEAHQDDRGPEKVRSTSLSTRFLWLACTPDYSVALFGVVEGAGGCRYPDTPCGDRWKPYLSDEFCTANSPSTSLDVSDRRP